MKAVEKDSDYVDGEIVLVTHPAVPIPPQDPDDRSPPWEDPDAITLGRVA